VDEHTLQAQLSEALTRLDDLERTVADQKEALRALHARGESDVRLHPSPSGERRSASQATDAAHGSGHGAGIDIHDRRSLLRNAGIALAGAAGAGAVLQVAGASPAAATDGQALLVGTTNTATVETRLEFDNLSMPSNMLTVTNGPTDGVTGAAIVGVAAIESPAEHGVIGLTDSDSGTAFGVVGRGRGAGSIGVRAEGDKAALRLVAVAGDPRTSVGTHSAGEIYQDVQNNTWVCVAAGGPGTWRSIAGPMTTGALHMLATPKRVYDSRIGFVPTDVPKGKLNNGDERVIDARHGNAYPPGAIAVLMNLTATATNNGGWLAAFRNGIAFPGTSTLNWSATDTNIANSATVALDNADRFRVRCAGSCDFAVDVVGYYF